MTVLTTERRENMFKNKNQEKNKSQTGNGAGYQQQNIRPNLLEMLREDLIGELMAINQYEQHARSTDNREARELFQEIADDEKHHVADLLRMIARLDKVQRNELNERLCQHI